MESRLPLLVSASGTAMRECGEAVEVESGRLFDLLRVHSAALDTAEHEPRQRGGRRGLVEIAGVAAADVGGKPRQGIGQSLAVEGVGGQVARRQLRRMQIPALVETPRQRS